MPLILDGTLGVSGVDGTAGTPSLQGTDSNTGVFYATDIVGISTNGSERMRIDSSGNVGIGTNSPAARLQVGTRSSAATTDNSSVFTAGAASASGGIADVATFANTVAAATNNEARLTFTPASNYSATAAIGAAITNTLNGQTALKFYTYNTGADPLTERMRITSDGNVGIGTNSPATRLNVFSSTTNTARIRVTGTGSTNGNFRGYEFGSSGGFSGGIFQDEGTSAVSFWSTSSGESMRITSGGDVFIATSSSSESTSGVRVFPNGGGTNIPYTSISGAWGTNGNTALAVYSNSASAYRFYVGYGGTIFATSTTITAISDQRLKENIQDIDVGLDKVMALKPRKFDWKAGKGKDKKGDRGWIAQEFEQVFPEMIDEWKDPAPEGEEPYKSVNADLIPVLVKAIQEQQAMIEELKQEVALLKSK